MTSVFKRSRKPRGMISREAIAPCVKRTFGISPVLTVENGGRTRPFSKVCWKAANSVPLIPADVLIVLMVSSTGRVFETKRPLVSQQSQPE